MKSIITYILLTLATLATCLPANAREGDEPAAKRKKVGVVLSGGGAKGVAHISALKAIEEAGIPIDIITGTSMGAIIGGLYAIGYDTHTLDSMVRSQNWTSLLSDRVPRSNLSFVEKESTEKYLLTMPLSFQKGIVIPSGIVGGQNIYNLLTELTIGYHDSLDFKEFPIPFACVAYDMVTGKTHTFDSGYLPQAIRASMSIPGAFAPVRTDGMVLVDGGIANNFPVDVAKAMGAELIIGIDVGAGLKTEDELQSLADLFDQITSFTAVESFDRNKAMTDLYIHPDITGYSAASFSPQSIDTLIQRGKEAMELNHDALIEFKDKVGIPSDWHQKPRQPLEVDRPIMLERIKFEGLDQYDEKRLRKIIGIDEFSIITVTQLHSAISKLQGSGLFSSVQYRLEGQAPYELIFTVKETTHNSLSFGFRFDTEEMAAVLLHATITPRKFGSTYFYVTGRLSTNPYGKIGMETGNEMTRKFALSYMFRNNNLDLYSHGKKDNNMDYDYHVVNANFANIMIRNFKTEVGLRYEYFNYRSQLWSSELYPSQVESEGLISYYLKTEFESLNRRYYPTRGVSLQAGYTLYTSDFATYKGYSPFSSLFGDFFAAVPLGGRVTLVPGAFTRVLIGKHLTYPVLNFVGGTVAGRYVPQQLPFIGIHNFELFDNAVLGIKLDLRVQLWTRTYATLKMNYMKDHDNFFKLPEGEDVFGAAICYSYNTIAGPLDLMLDWSNRDKKVGFYFNLGYYF